MARRSSRTSAPLLAAAFGAAIAVTLLQRQRAAETPTAVVDKPTPAGLKPLTSSTSADDTLLLSEIDSSINFLNVELVVCTALLLFNFKALVAAPLAIVSLFGAVTFLLYGGIHFAAAGGTLARGSASHADVRRSLERGNLISEWFGLYALTFALPVIIEVSTDLTYLGIVAVVVDVVGYITYFGTGTDMLGRFMGGAPRLAVHIFFILFIVEHWIGVAAGLSCAMWMGGVGFMSLAVACAVLHARRGEFAIHKSN